METGMTTIKLRVPPAMIKKLTRLPPPQILIERGLEALTGKPVRKLMRTTRDIGDMLGKDAIYISFGETGDEVMVLHTLGSDHEVSAKLITAGKLLRGRARRS